MALTVDADAVVVSAANLQRPVGSGSLQLLAETDVSVKRISVAAGSASASPLPQARSAANAALTQQWKQSSDPSPTLDPGDREPVQLVARSGDVAINADLRSARPLRAVAGGDLQSTGSSTGSPTSASQTLGNQFNKLPITLDRAVLRWEPRFDLRLFAGRMANPFFGTDLIWPDDLSLDGLAGQGELTLASGLYLFAGAGAFALEDLNLDKRDKWLLGLQPGADWAIDNHTGLRVALGLYDFRNIEGVRETAPKPSGAADGTVVYLGSAYPASVRSKGNTLINLNDPSSTASPTWGPAHDPTDHCPRRAHPGPGCAAVRAVPGAAGCGPGQQDRQPRTRSPAPGPGQLARDPAGPRRAAGRQGATGGRGRRPGRQAQMPAGRAGGGPISPGRAARTACGATAGRR